MTAVRVSSRRLGIEPASLDAGAPVRGQYFQDCLALAHHTLGRGASVVPAYAPQNSSAAIPIPLVLTTANNEHVLRFRFPGRYQAIQRLWGFGLRASTSPATCEVEIPDGTTAIAVACAGSRRDAVPQLILEDLAAQSSTEAEVAISLQAITNSVIVDSISCHEMPRAILATDVNERGTDPTLFNVSQPVLVSNATNLLAAANASASLGRRVSLFQRAVPATVNGATSTAFARAITNASYEDIWQLPLPVLARKIARTATTGLLTAKFYAWRSGGTSADLRLSSSVHGAGSPVNITNTTPAWTNAVTLQIDCTDLASADGRQTSGAPVWDELDVQVRMNGGGTCFIASECGWEA